MLDFDGAIEIPVVTIGDDDDYRGHPGSAIGALPVMRRDDGSWFEILGGSDVAIRER